jgi:mannose-6-phosphate isomerase class I
MAVLSIGTWPMLFEGGIERITPQDVRRSHGRASRVEYERRVADGILAEILRKIPVKTGNTVYVPAGFVHAIGPGVTVFETQQASDLTYRMFDWKRRGLDGKPRELRVRRQRMSSTIVPACDRRLRRCRTAARACSAPR